MAAWAQTAATMSGIADARELPRLVTPTRKAARATA
jgi:hypothetical protein